MYTCQCEECQIGQSSGVLLKEVAAFGRCPLIEVFHYSRYFLILTPNKMIEFKFCPRPI